MYLYSALIDLLLCRRWLSKLENALFYPEREHVGLLCQARGPHTQEEHWFVHRVGSSRCLRLQANQLAQGGGRWMHVWHCNSRQDLLSLWIEWKWCQVIYVCMCYILTQYNYELGWLWWQLWCRNFFTPYQPSWLGTWVAFSAFCVQNGMHASPSNSQLRIAEAIY